MIIQAASRLNRVQEYYFSRKLQEVDRLRKSGHDVINLGIGNPDLPPSPATIDALCREAGENCSHGYQPYRGVQLLRIAIANWYARIYGVNLEPDSEVLPLIGSKEGIFHISMAFLEAGDQVLVPDPGYASYASAARIAGAEPLTYDLVEENGWFPDLELLSASDLSRVKIMWINYPHMPTGALAGSEAMKALVDFALEHRILLCHDNPYSLILNSGQPHSIFAIKGAEACCLELNSLSKSHNMAGWRLGMVCGRSDYIQAILAVKTNVDSGIFLPIQRAAIEALNNDQDWHDDQNKHYRRRRNLIYELLETMDFQFQTETAGLFVWARAPERLLSITDYLDELLYATGVFITPGEVFGRNGERYIRVSTCATEENISKATSRIKAYHGGRS